MLKAIILAVVVGLPAGLLYGAYRWHAGTQALRARLEAARVPIRLRAVDDRSAKATLIDAALSLTILFRFRDDGLIEAAQAEARGRTVGGRVIPTPWEGRMSNYHLRDGMHVPLTGEAAWLLPEGRRPYWRGHISEIVYELAR